MKFNVYNDRRDTCKYYTNGPSRKKFRYYIDVLINLADSTSLVASRVFRYE